MSKTALIAEDDETIRMLFASLLETGGWTVVGEADNGARAVDMYKEHTPDLVLMDIQMPEMDGVDALKAVIAHDPNAVVVMLTAISNLDIIEDCIQAGAKDYLRKDLSPVDIKKRLDELTA